ncbi:GDSL-type esterase/lipase family protein [Streptomyces huiliensis]|uniref:GDSL-type esterase/lipase family protein n=1 Tax=Streptomyces huiliensis TaxID=2876027 RepID=UPI001CC120E1|nr:GDSL-type esterase/lipase family protein [Streptomyces huiliensis]MBZ4321048.1 hypothetical protein [Streptomyces huiliensis]
MGDGHPSYDVRGTALPDLLLVELGFDDIGWLGAGADLVPTMKRFVDNARAANPNVRIVVANVPHRTTLGSANPQLPQRTTDYNTALAKAVPTWSTDASPVALADVDAAYGCDPNATTCASTYDGLHPNALGEYRIARAFGTVLHNRFGIGSAAPREPGAVMPYDIATPKALTFDGTQQGVTVTWPEVFGAHTYDVQWRDVTSDAGAAWEQVISPARRPTGGTCPGSSTTSPTRATPTRCGCGRSAATGTGTSRPGRRWCGGRPRRPRPGGRRR